ncbi:MAG: hypothetical protein LBU21_09580, partial [Treponema sp.]|nr:hypothetical protein [Treponema sp.]
TLAYRGLLYDDGGTPDAEGNRLGERYRIAQSLILRLGITISSVFVTALPVKASISFWGAWKISNLHNGIGWDDFAFGPGFIWEM